MTSDRALQLSVQAILPVLDPALLSIPKAAARAGDTPSEWIVPRVRRMIENQKLTAPECDGLPAQHVREVLIRKAMIATNRHN